MPKQNDSSTQRPSLWGPEPIDRLSDLFSTFATLRQDSRVLVDQLRGSIHQLRHLRGQLREHTAGSSGNAQGKPNAAIAQELRISAHTARHHTQRVSAKLVVYSRAEAGAKLRA